MIKNLKNLILSCFSSSGRILARVNFWHFKQLSKESLKLADQHNRTVTIFRFSNFLFKNLFFQERSSSRTILNTTLEKKKDRFSKDCRTTDSTVYLGIILSLNPEFF